MAHAQAERATAPLLPDDARLRSWVEAHGGHISSALRLVEDAPCGCRGIVAVQDISAEEQRELPPVIVPEALYLSSEAARSVLGAHVRQAGLPAIDALPGLHQTALLLAAERVKGGASHWRPYIATLPEVPPCAWMLQGAQLDAALAAVRMQAEAQQQQRSSSQPASSSSSSGASPWPAWMRSGSAAAAPHPGGSTASSTPAAPPAAPPGRPQVEVTLAAWRGEAGSARRVMAERASSLAGTYGGLLGVTDADVLWALGQVRAGARARPWQVIRVVCVGTCQRA